MKLFSKVIFMFGIATLLSGIPNASYAQLPKTAKAQGLTKDFSRRELVEAHTFYIARQSEDWLIYFSRGNSRLGIGDHLGAKKDYTQALKLNPDSAAAYYNRGYARAQLGDKEGAIKDYQKAAEIFQAQGEQSSYQDVLNQLKQLQQSAHRTSPQASISTDLFIQ